MKIILSLLLFIGLVLLFAVNSARAMGFIANLPAYFSDQKITRDIDFGGGHGSKLDVYVPNDNKPNHPVIIYFYGGGWRMGTKEMYRFTADAFTSRGYVVVIPDYVKYPQYKFPVWQDESARAVAWVHNNIDKYQGDSGHINVLGHSAGAQIGALLATDNQYMKRAGGDRSWIKAFAGLAGPYDFTPEEEYYVKMFSTAGDNYKLIRVTNFIDGKQAPMLLLWGKKDSVVGEINITHLKGGLDARGGEYKIKFYDNVDHIDIIASLTIIARNRAPVLEDVDAWFKQYQYITKP